MRTGPLKGEGRRKCAHHGDQVYLTVMPPGEFTRTHAAMIVAAVRRHSNALLPAARAPLTLARGSICYRLVLVICCILSGPQPLAKRRHRGDEEDLVVGFRILFVTGPGLMWVFAEGNGCRSEDAEGGLFLRCIVPDHARRMTSIMLRHYII